MTPVPDLRFAFKSGAMALVEMMNSGEPPPTDEDILERLEEKFQEFYQMYAQLSGAMAGMGLDDLVDVLLPKV